MEGDLQHTLGNNLRAYRVARGLSQEAFADLLGVHRTYVGAIERGDKNLSLRSVERLAERLELPPLTLLEAAGTSPAPSDPAEQPRRRRGGRAADQA